MSATAAGAGAGAGAATPDARLAAVSAAASVRPTPSPGQRKFMQFFWGGVAGSFATCCIQPIDMVKVRLQLSGELGKGQTVRNPITMAKAIYAKEGFLAFYGGLSAGVLRQCTYGCARLGLFHGVSDHLKKSRPDPSQPLPVVQNAFAGLFAGGLGACFGTPCDLAMVRMQSDQTLPPEQRRNYRGVFHALRTIAATEGVAALWKGNVPTVWRAMGMNVGMLSTNEAAKPAFVRWFGDGLTAYFASSMLAGFVAAVFALPFDFLKTRLQKQKADATGKLPYTGLVDCAVKSFRTEGPLSVYKGFGAFWVRVTPHTVITLMAFEQLSKMSKSRGLM